MRVLLKALLAVIVLAVVVGGCGLAYLFATYPNVPPAANVTLPRDPDTLARGR